MFLAHFSNTSLNEILEWNLRKIFSWSDRAINLHNKINTVKEE